MRRLSTFCSQSSTAALRTMVRLQGRWLARQPGQGLVEYGLILVLIMVVCVAILSAVGTKVSTVWYTKLINNSAW
jgi:pilus assembly protein Flp/PilA